MSRIPGPAGVALLIAAGSMIPLAVVLLLVGLAVPSLVLVYLSIVASVIWIPLLAAGLVKLIRGRQLAAG